MLTTRVTMRILAVPAATAAAAGAKLHATSAAAVGQPPLQRQRQQLQGVLLLTAGLVVVAAAVVLRRGRVRVQVLSTTLGWRQRRLQLRLWLAVLAAMAAVAALRGFRGCSCTIDHVLMLVLAVSCSPGKQHEQVPATAAVAATAAVELRRVRTG